MKKPKKPAKPKKPLGGRRNLEAAYMNLTTKDRKKIKMSPYSGDETIGPDDES